MYFWKHLCYVWWVFCVYKMSVVTHIGLHIGYQISWADKFVELQFYVRAPASKSSSQGWMVCLPPDKCGGQFYLYANSNGRNAKRDSCLYNELASTMLGLMTFISSPLVVATGQMDVTLILSVWRFYYIFYQRVDKNITRIRRGLNFK